MVTFDLMREYLREPEGFVTGGRLAFCHNSKQREKM
jgi:cytochrome c2